jgi:hypothetical protein
MKQRGMNQRGMNRRLGKKMRGGAEEVAVPKKKVDKAKIKESAERARSFLKDQFQWGKLYSYMSNLIIPTLILLFIYRYTFSEKPDEDTKENNFIFGWNISKNGFKNVVIWGQSILAFLWFFLYWLVGNSWEIHFLELGIAFILVVFLWALVFLYGIDPYVSETCWAEKEKQREEDIKGFLFGVLALFSPLFAYLLFYIGKKIWGEGDMQRQ